MRYSQKDICRAFDIKRDTLRHYEQKGILSPQIDEENGYRHYDDWQINLLWEVKRYQSLGFSLTQIKHMLQDDYIDDFRARMDERLESLEREHEYDRMRLEGFRFYRELLSKIDEELDAFQIAEVDPVTLVPRRELHELLLDEHLSEAGSFANANQAISIPCAHFPALDEDTYYWDFAFRTEWYDKLGGPETGCVRFAGGRVLTGCVDAGER